MMIIFCFSLALSLEVKEIRVGELNLQLNVKAGCTVFHIGTNYQRTEIQLISNSDFKSIR